MNITIHNMSFCVLLCNFRVVCASPNLNREQCTTVLRMKDDNMLNKYASTQFCVQHFKIRTRKANKICAEIKSYVIYLPPIDVLLLEGFSVKLSPGTQVFQPGHNFLRRPARHGFTDQRVMLLHHTTAPVIHQHHHLETHRY